MPINYKNGIIKEHLNVRNEAGVFDVSHMGQILIPFTDYNVKSLEKFIPLNLNNISSNKCHYSFILNSNGGIVDDIMLSKFLYDQNKYIYIVYNASRKSILMKFLKKQLKIIKLLMIDASLLFRALNHILL